MNEKTKQEVIDLLREADGNLNEIRKESERDGNIHLKKRITLQMMRIELACTILEESEVSE